jgi:hypothetical protein
MRSITPCTAVAAVSLIVSGAALSAGTTHATGGVTRAAHATTPAPMRTAQPTTLGPTRTGQPNQTCGSATAPNTPGNAAAAPGSAFNPSGTAGSVYAGEQPQNSRNTASVSQYDVACSHQR